MSLKQIDENIFLLEADSDFITFETGAKGRGGDDKQNVVSPTSNFAWTEGISNRMDSGKYYIFPHGDDNQLPELIRNIVYANNMAPGYLTRKSMFLWGNGIRMYREVVENNEIIREVVIDNEVQDWLESFDYENYILKLMVDYNFSEGCYTKFIMAKSGRVKKPMFAELEHISVNNARLAAKLDKTEHKDIITPTHVGISEKGFKLNNKLKAYPIFNKRNPFANKQSILYSWFPAFAVSHYALPDIYGTLEWIKRSSSIPLILKYMTENGINVKYHIQSPSIYWEQKTDELKTECEKKGIKYTRKILLDYRKRLFKKIADVLSGLENAGKFWHTVKIYDDTGTDLIEAGWTIEEIPQNIKQFIEAQIMIANRADASTSIGLNLHSALSGSGETGKSNSGSEQLYASKIHLATGVRIPEMIIFEAINYALKANFPEKKLKLGFSHSQIKREEEVSPGDRMKNNAEL